MPDKENEDSPAPAILITGAGRNVGAYMAHRFLEAGQPVVAHYRSQTRETRALAAAGAQLVQGDFNGMDATLTVAHAVRAAAPQLRAIIHNASDFSPTLDEPEAAADQFQAFYNVHMLAPFLLNRALADCLTGTQDTPADIIHITDIYADNPAVEYDSYCATKAGLQSLALSSAKRLAPAVKVNVIQPGPVSFEAWHSAADRQQVLDATPLGRLGGPEAIYTAVRGVLANHYQTGAVIAVDGGRRLGRAPVQIHRL